MVGSQLECRAGGSRPACGRRARDPEYGRALEDSPVWRGSGASPRGPQTMRAAGSILHGAVPALGAAMRKLEQDVPRYRIAMIAACPMPARRVTPLRIERLTAALIARGHHVELITYHVSDDAQTLSFPVHRIFRKRVYQRMPAGPNLRKLAL